MKIMKKALALLLSICTGKQYIAHRCSNTKTDISVDRSWDASQDGKTGLEGLFYEQTCPATNLARS